MATYGYARGSSVGSDLSQQKAALRAAGCDVVRADAVSGDGQDGRSELDALLQFLGEGDELVVTRIDRLAGSVRDLQAIVRILGQRGVTLRATEQPVDTGAAAGKCFLEMLPVFAEFEANLRKERQLEGIAKAKGEGKYRGRKPSVDTAEVLRLHRSGMGPSAIAKTLQIGRASVYRALGSAAAAEDRGRPGLHLRGLIVRTADPWPPRRD